MTEIKKHKLQKCRNLSTGVQKHKLNKFHPYFKSYPYFMFKSMGEYELWVNMNYG